MGIFLSLMRLAVFVFLKKVKVTKYIGNKITIILYTKNTVLFTTLFVMSSNAFGVMLGV